MFVIGEAIWGFQLGLITPVTVLAVLLSDLGASEYMIGSISSIHRGLIVVPQIFGVYLFASRARRRVQLVIWHYALIIPFILLNSVSMLFSDSLPPAVTRWSLVLWFAGFVFFTGVIVGPWFDWIANLFHPRIRGSVMGVCYFALSLTGAVAGLLAGWVLTEYPAKHAYAMLYAVAALGAALSMILFWFVKDPAVTEPEPPNRQRPREILSFFKLSLIEPNFRQFLIGRFLGFIGFSILPFIAVYYQSAGGGGLDNATIVSSGAAMTFGMAIGNLSLGRLGDHFGHRLGIIISTAVQALMLAVMLVSSGQMSCILAYFGAGIVSSGDLLSHQNMLIDTCPHDNRMAHIAVGNLMVAIPLIVAPILAGSVSKIWGLPVLFVISTVFSLASVIWMILLVKEPRRLPAYARQI